MKGDTMDLLNDSKDESNIAEYNYIDKILMSTERNKILFDWSPLAIIIVSEEGIFLDANRKLYDWLGYRPDEIIGRSFTEVPFLPDKSKKTIVNNFDKRMRGEDVPPYEVELVHKNGMQKYGEIHGNLLSDDARGVTMDIIMVSDITEKKNAFEILKDNEERYRTLFENTTDLIQSVNAEGNFVDVNPAWLETLEYSKEELHNLTLINILREDKVQHCMELFNKVRQGESIKNIETVFISKTGKEIFVKGSAKGYFRDGIFIATVGIFRDISKNEIVV
jgi:PAS domain S-box-containing protein